VQPPIGRWTSRSVDKGVGTPFCSRGNNVIAECLQTYGSTPPLVQRPGSGKKGCPTRAFFNGKNLFGKMGGKVLRADSLFHGQKIPISQFLAKLGITGGPN
jgi:hypothetical protein